MLRADIICAGYRFRYLYKAASSELIMRLIFAMCTFSKKFPILDSAEE